MRTEIIRFPEGKAVGLEIGYPSWAVPAEAFAPGAGAKWRRQFRRLFTLQWRRSPATSKAGRGI